MPHLIYGGRLWRFASDELSIPASCAASSRCMWTVILLIIMALTAQSIEECSGQGYYIMGYLIASVCVQVINVVCEVCIIRHSVRGTMVDSKPRAEVPSLLTLHLSLSLLQLACALYGVLVINMDFIPCNSVISENGMAVLLYVVIVSQLVDLGGILCCATMFSSRTVDVDLHVDSQDLSPYSAHSRASRASTTTSYLEHPDLGLTGPSGANLLQWEERCGSLCRRLQLLTCNLFGGAGVSNDMATVGRVFSNFFHHEGFLDVVPSDVVAGFLLVRFQQKMTKIRSRDARVQLLADQGLKFDHRPCKYGSRSTCVLSVPAFGKTPALQDARSIVTAAKKGVVLRPLSSRLADPPPATPSSAREGRVGLPSTPQAQAKDSAGLAYVMTTATDAVERDEGAPSAGSGLRRSPAAPSRYSPRQSRREDKDPPEQQRASWNSSEQPDLPQTPPLPTAKKLPPRPLPSPPLPLSKEISSFKTRTSYFAALEVLELASAQTPAASHPYGDEEVKEYLGNRQTLPPAEGDGQDAHCTLTFEEFSDVTRFSYFALAAYSTLMFLYMNPCSGTCKLCAYGCCPESVLGACCGADSSSPRSARSRRGSGSLHAQKEVAFDNKCHTHESAMRQMVRAPNTELVYAQFSNDIETRPYAVFLDFEKETLVITVRGTLSLEDCVADAMSEPEPLDVVGMQYGFNGVGRHAHSGFLKSAQWILEDLRKHPQVARLLDAVAGASPAGMTMDREGSLDSSSSPFTSSLGAPLKPRVFSRLAVVGHSLGAGVAAVLALLMRKEFPTLHCYGYGAPGSTLDAETAHEAKSYTTSVVLGDDMVGSLSFHSLSVLREEVLDCVVRARCSKMSILQMTMFKECSEGLMEELLHAPGHEPASAFRTMFQKFKAHMQRQRAAFLPCPLHIPGKVIHLRQIGKERDRTSVVGSVARVFVPVIEPEVSFFEEIKVSATMITDHLPDLYCIELNTMLRDWAIERQSQRSAAQVVVGADCGAPGDSRV